MNFLTLSPVFVEYSFRNIAVYRFVRGGRALGQTLNGIRRRSSGREEGRMPLCLRLPPGHPGQGVAPGCPPRNQGHD